MSLEAYQASSVILLAQGTNVFALYVSKENTAESGTASDTSCLFTCTGFSCTSLILYYFEVVDNRTISPFKPTLQASLSTLASSSVFTFLVTDTNTDNRYTGTYSISVAMVSRLTLNLRQLGRQNPSTLIPLSSTAITGSKFTTQIFLTEYDEDALNDAEEEDFCRHRVSL